VIDEVQRRPDLLPILRCWRIGVGSRQSFSIHWEVPPGELLRQSSESLAGRLERIEIGGFTLREVGSEAIDSLWLRGGFPRSWLAASEAEQSGVAKAVCADSA
jgi:predicted AAA+ superfamily ATPase